MSIFDAQAEIRKFTTIDFSRVNSVVLQVNQEVARFLLSRNTESNRNTSASRVTAYKRQMEEGQWVLGDPIKFNNEGKLIDGQHRLKAVPENTVIPMVLLVGLPSVAAETLDQGMKRNALHIAKFRGLNKINSHVVSILRMLFLFRCNNNSVKASNFLTARKLVFFLEKHKGIHSAILFSLNHSSTGFATKFAPVLAAVARAKLSDYPLSDQDLDYFLYCFQTGKESGYHLPTTKKGEAACVLKSLYLQGKAKKENGASFREAMFYQSQSALVAYKEQRSISYLKQTTKNCFPVPLIDYLDSATLEMKTM